MHETEGRFAYLEELLTDQVEQLDDIQHGVDKLLPPPTEEAAPLADILTTSDPKIIAAKNELSKIERLTDGDYSERITALKRLIWEDLSKRCVFEVNGNKYQIVIPAIHLLGKRLTAAELMEDPRLLAHLAEIESGAVKLIS